MKRALPLGALAGVAAGALVWFASAPGALPLAPPQAAATGLPAASAAPTTAPAVPTGAPRARPPATTPGGSADRQESTPGPWAGQRGDGTSPAAAAARPVRIRIPSIGVDAPVERLRLDRHRVLTPPTEWENAGWHQGGPVPGELGPAVVAGHVDSRDGPAVFFRLRELDPGDAVQVVLSDGRTSRFLVTGSEQFAKADFPTAQVYGPTPSRELRLITCGGAFDSAWGHYRDNVVVTAVAEDEPLVLG